MRSPTVNYHLLHHLDVRDSLLINIHLLFFSTILVLHNSWLQKAYDPESPEPDGLKQPFYPLWADHTHLPHGHSHFQHLYVSLLCGPLRHGTSYEVH